MRMQKMPLTSLLPRTDIAAIWRYGQRYEYTRYEMRKYSYLLGRRTKNIQAFRKAKDFSGRLWCGR